MKVLVGALCMVGRSMGPLNPALVTPLHRQHDYWRHLQSSVAYVASRSCRLQESSKNAGVIDGGVWVGRIPSIERQALKPAQ